MNPTQGGTGNFKLETRLGSENVWDFNHFFSTAGIASVPTLMSGLSATISANDKVRELGTYEIAFSLNYGLTASGKLSLILPPEINTDVSGFGIEITGMGAGGSARIVD